MSRCDVPALWTVRTAGCVTAAAGQREAIPTCQSELEVLQDSRFSMGLPANLVLGPSSTESPIFCVHHLCLHEFIFSWMSLLALSMLALICAICVGQLAKRTGCVWVFLSKVVLLLVRAWQISQNG